MVCFHQSLFHWITEVSIISSVKNAGRFTKGVLLRYSLILPCTQIHKDAANVLQPRCFLRFNCNRKPNPMFSSGAVSNGKCEALRKCVSVTGRWCRSVNNIQESDTFHLLIDCNTFYNHTLQNTHQIFSGSVCNLIDKKKKGEEKTTKNISLKIRIIIK